MHPDITKFFLFIQLNAQLDYSRLKLTLKFYIKMLLHVLGNKPSSGSLLLCFAKVLVIKIVWKINNHKAQRTHTLYKN